MSRILIVFVVFLMMWKGTLNYEIKPQNNVHGRAKRYHENDHDDNITRIKQDKHELEKKNVATETKNPNNSGPQSQSTLPDLNLVNQVPAKILIPRRKIVRIKPTNINTKTIKNTHSPYVLVAKKTNIKDINDSEQSKVNETLIDQVSDTQRLKETVLADKELIDTMTVNNTHSSDSLLRNLDQHQDKIIKIKSEEPQAVISKTKSTKESKKRKSFDINDEADPNMKVSQKPDQNSKMSKVMSISPTTDSDTDLEKEQEEIKHSEEIMSVDISVEDNSETKTITTKEVNTQPDMHPLLKAVQNDLFTSSSITNNSNCTNKIEEDEDDDSLEVIQKSAFEHTFSQETDDNLENEGLIIKNKKYEEVVEYVRPPNVPPFYKMSTVQDSTDRELNNDYLVPMYCQELAKPELNFYNYHNDNYYKPDNQQIEQIDGSTVVSYNNYFKMPIAHTNLNYNRYTSPILNMNRYCGYVPIKPNQTGNNGWTYNRGHENQVAGDVERIWKTWKNTEYYLKSKNALKQIGNGKLYNLVNQNDDKVRYMRRNAIGNGNYQSQNIPPYI